jgi:hypothetical protein
VYAVHFWCVLFLLRPCAQHSHRLSPHRNMCLRKLLPTFRFVGNGIHTCFYVFLCGLLLMLLTLQRVLLDGVLCCLYWIVMRCLFIHGLPISLVYFFGTCSCFSCAS